MKRHLREDHEIEPFRLDEHVYLGGARERSQHLSWDPARASFRCDLCPGRVFATGMVTDEQIELAQLFDPGLQPHLAGLSSQAERDAMTRLYLDGTVNRERLRQLQGADARRRAARGKRPGVDERRSRLQAWMLERVATGDGVLERVLEQAERMQRDDPAGWARLADRTLSRETLRDYWQDIPAEDRDTARARGRRRSEKSTR